MMNHSAIRIGLKCTTINALHEEEQHMAAVAKPCKCDLMRIANEMHLFKHAIMTLKEFETLQNLQ